MNFRLFSCLSILILASFSTYSSQAAELELTIFPENIQYRTLPVTVEANVTGGNNGFLYKFMYKGTTTNYRWVTVQNWTENSQYIFDTAAMQGTYSFAVIAKSPTSKLNNTFNGYQIDEGTPISTVYFTDFNLHGCFNDAVMQNEWIFAEQVTLLNCSGRGINDLSGIEMLSAVNTLNLAHNQLSYIHPLSNLTNLQKLELSGNQLMMLAGIESMTGLTYLDVSYNQLYDVYPLMSPGMSQLQTLNLSGNTQLQFASVHP
ncbi:MAG: leucine-rich repeat domain-containing protein, partial [Nitrosomonas sp.]|nr:leucine-rich repeat domain-containing protein [Nitrosomonas sp.]